MGLVLSLGAAACAVGPNYKRPELKTPEAQRGQPAAKPESLAELPWWRVFRDPALSRYLKESLTNAYDVRVAIARVEQARAQAKAAMWAFFPTFSGQVGFGGGQGFPGVPTFLPPANLNGIFGASVAASWEADVWGRLRRQKEAADAFAQAADEDRRGVYVALVGDVASTYIQLRTNDLKLEIVEAATVTRQETASFFQERVKGGVSNDLEFARAEGNVADARAQAAGYRQAIWQNENLLSVLLARGPGNIERGAPLDALALLPEIPAGLPSALLERRPDLRSAEAQLHAATALIGVRIGDVLPKLALTGAAGMASSSLKNLGSNSDAIYRGFAGLDIPLPVLGGAAQLNAIDAARARAREVAALYEKAFVNALREVSDALNAVEQLQEARARREEQVGALRRAENVATLRYRGGVSTYLEVITAQEQRLLAELALADTKGQQHQALVQLYRALGGGWNMKEKEGATPAEQAPAPAAAPVTPG
jgi:outer membrane protein, multidrug efflux system